MTDKAVADEDVAEQPDMDERIKINKDPEEALRVLLRSKKPAEQR